MIFIFKKGRSCDELIFASVTLATGEIRNQIVIYLLQMSRACILLRSLDQCSMQSRVVHQAAVEDSLIRNTRSTYNSDLSTMPFERNMLELVDGQDSEFTPPPYFHRLR